MHHGSLIKQLVAGDFDAFPDIQTRAETALTPPLDLDQIGHMSISEARFMLRRRGLSARGGRVELLKRLKKASDSASGLGSH